MQYKKLWIGFWTVVVLSFIVLGYYGAELYRLAPPVPDEVVTTDGKVVWEGQQILDGQNVWQSIGGQQLGSIWGHGAYVAPDWSADWLHRECVWLLNAWSETEYSKPYSELDAAGKATLDDRLKREMRTNTYNVDSKQIVISPDRARAADAMSRYYAALFGDAEEFPEDVQFIADGGMTPSELRSAYAMPKNTIRDPERQELMNAFFFWTAWVCTTERPAEEGQVISGAVDKLAAEPSAPVTYTNNWPAERLVANAPSGAVVVWSVLSFVLLLAGVGLLAWYYAVLKSNEEEHTDLPPRDPLLALSPTPSMKATLKYFWVVIALILVQVGLGAVTAHYGVEGEGFYGIPLADYLPYSVTRTWHTQLAIFWIATAWLATGLFIAPAVSGHEPKFQRAGVNFLFVALLVIVVGSLFGTWYGTRQQMGLTMNFWFGHQGYEYVDLGRFWQLFLLVGLFLWLGLMVRALWPAFKQPGEHKHLLAMFLVASTAIAVFYASGIMWHRQTNLAIAEYWRWWVVHLWVEGFFEVFATVVIAFLFTRMGLLKTTTATAAVLFSSTIFLFGGIIGTFHHLYFTGTPTPVLALGAMFSALEVVPLVLIGFEAYENLTLTRAKPWVTAYKWPIYFFVAVSFWNLVGAGLFGFLINPPIALYYMQGLNTTPVHGHTALFGVYGMLGIGLTLFCLKGLASHKRWKTGILAISFWAINFGLALMVLISVLPVGLMQTWASVEYGFWYARSADFLQTDLMDTLRWLRIVGDTLFAVGIFGLTWFVLGLKTGWSTTDDEEPLFERAKQEPEWVTAT
ncbi:Nitric oxide reductase subunit B [Novipirellula aureliae]|uniref:Nitric oxide reductase subunit B n=1 Tax=Novipirellula aureliae TaxID=2527966 RepID=A0A5C6EF16_9BACT|nr:nitric-oxide reductase large subunit [Novipirellula aureliae]TWU45809.1 Nitric oxide reductase subunit B [Novipirellula aureliae]